MRPRISYVSSMSFKEKDCYIPRVWCGDKDTYPSGYNEDGYYYKVGSRYECLKQGIGVGMGTTRKKHLPANSIQQIKYIGEKHEENFAKAGIDTTDDLVREMGGKTAKQIKGILECILKKGKIVDTKAYNSVVLYLYRHGIANVPVCKKISH